MKVCKGCGISKDFSEFYRCQGNSDGVFGKCKECKRAMAIKNRALRIDYYRKYDRDRGNRQSAGYLSEYRSKYPNKYRAHSMVGSAIQKGNLFKQPCESCDSEDTHAHHDDYSKPLNIRWLCPICHKHWHKTNEAING